jgi:hypothetical protein
MAYLAIYAISVLIAYFGYVEFNKKMFLIINSRGFSEEEKRAIYSFNTELYRNGELLMFIPIVNIILSAVLWYIILIEVVTRD